MPGDTGDTLDFGKPLSGNLLPLNDGCAGKSKLAGNLGHKPMFRSDKVHSFGHAYRLPQVSIYGQAICLPTGCDMGGILAGMEIGHRIAQARAAAGMTQTELAKAIGVTRGLVGQWESHKKKPGRENLVSVARVTFVTVEYLTDGVASTGVMVSDPEALHILRSIMRMSPGQRKNAAELFGMASDISGDREQQGAPSKKKQTVG